MAKMGVVSLILLGTALFIIRGADAQDKMFVEGKVYCDPCRVEFPVKISTMMAGARVSLECLSRENNTVTYKVEGETDKSGTYKLPVVADHEEDLCDVKLLKSPRDDCKEKFRFIDKARVLLTNNMGVVQPICYANPIGFMTATTDPRCEKLMQEMGITLEEAQTKIP
ncbi:Olee1-like protein [Linum grandiflorum]